MKLRNALAFILFIGLFFSPIRAMEMVGSDSKDDVSDAVRASREERSEARILQKKAEINNEALAVIAQMNQERINHEKTAAFQSCNSLFFSQLPLENRFGIYNHLSVSLEELSALMTISKSFKVDIESFMEMHFGIFILIPYPNFKSIMTFISAHIDDTQMTAIAIAIFPHHVAVIRNDHFDSPIGKEVPFPTLCEPLGNRAHTNKMWYKSLLYHPKECILTSSDEVPEEKEEYYAHDIISSAGEDADLLISEIPDTLDNNDEWDFKGNLSKMKMGALFCQDHILVFPGADGKFHVQFVSLKTDYLRYKEISKCQFDIFNQTKNLPNKNISFNYFKNTYGDVADWYSKKRALDHLAPDYMHLLGCLQVWSASEITNTEAIAKIATVHRWCAEAYQAMYEKDTKLNIEFREACALEYQESCNSLETLKLKNLKEFSQENQDDLNTQYGKIYSLYCQLEYGYDHMLDWLRQRNATYLMKNGKCYTHGDLYKKMSLALTSQIDALIKTSPFSTDEEFTDTVDFKKGKLSQVNYKLAQLIMSEPIISMTSRGLYFGEEGRSSDVISLLDKSLMALQSLPGNEEVEQLKNNIVSLLDESNKALQNLTGTKVDALKARIKELKEMYAPSLSEGENNTTDH